MNTTLTHQRPGLLPKALPHIAMTLGWLMLLAGPSPAHAQVYRPEKAQRSISTDTYQLNIQKNSQIDLLTPNGTPLLDNAYPAVIFEDGQEKALLVDHRNTNRYSVNTPVGQGNGFHFGTAECEWRIATYPALGCLTVDLTYINSTKKTVSIAGLLPFSTGKRGKGGVYMGAAPENTWVLRPPIAGDLFVRMLHSVEASPGHLAAWSPSSGRTLMAGFLTHRKGLGTIGLSQSNPSPIEKYDMFSSVCIYDPPVDVEPGGQLVAETLYFYMGDSAPQNALEAFMKAAQAMEPFPTRANLHGWLPPPEEPISADVLRASLEASQSRMVPAGWTNFNLNSPGPGSDLDLTSVIEFAHGAGLTTNIRSKQTSTDLNSANMGIAGHLPLNTDSIELFWPLPSETQAIPAPHPIQVLESIEAATNNQTRIVFGKSMAPGPFTLLDWALASRSYYLPAIGNPLLAPWSAELALDPRSFSDDQFITVCTLAAIQGKPLRPTTPWTEMSPLRQHILSRLLPAPTKSAMPLDLFQEGPPRQWYLPIRSKVGEWMIVALFNWESGASEVLNTPLTDMGLNNDNLYTVYDFWAGRYLGLIEKNLNAEVPPEGVRLFGLRRYEKQPMLVASNRHYSQGASDHTALNWNYEDRTLSGTCIGIPGESLTLSILIPEPYIVRSTSSSVEITEQKQTGPLLELSLRASGSSAIQWQVVCR